VTLSFRVNSSSAIGTGHLMRSLALADALGVEDALFVARDLPGNVNDRIPAAGHRLLELSGADADEGAYPWIGVPLEREIAESQAAFSSRAPARWLVVDNYGLDARYERAMRPYAGGLFAFDDLADRPHDIDALLDQTLVGAGDAAERYRSLVPPAARLFVGPNYAQLRAQFVEAKRTLAPRDGRVRSILIAFGSDTGAATLAALEATRGLSAAVTVVLAPAAAEYGRVAAAVRERSGATLLPHVEQMAALMVRHDLAIGAGGTSAYERAYLGLPAVVWSIAANQNEVVEGLAHAGAAVAIGEPVTVAAVRAALAELCADPAAVRRLSAGALVMMAQRDRSVAELLTYLRAPRPVRA
jgi:UDP-2,4-diacetamido-2,4,6-trideoxy-beta-L-altropyranose hydrolase